MPTIKAVFDSRREAELAVEHLVQEHEIERDDIVLGTEGQENSVGREPSGSDRETLGEEADDEGAALNGAIALQITVDDEDFSDTIHETLLENGGSEISVDD